MTFRIGDLLMSSERFSIKYNAEKTAFESALSEFSQTLGKFIALDGEWTVKGFIDVLALKGQIFILFRLIQKLFQKYWN